jgi:hypothetical protein
MDKKSEQRASTKAADDCDVGIHKYGPGNVRQQFGSFWDSASSEVVGLPESRLVTNCYKKPLEDTSNRTARGQGAGEIRKEEKPDIMEEIINHGPPIVDRSRPRRVF